MKYEFELYVNADHHEVKAMTRGEPLKVSDLRTLIMRCDVRDVRYTIEWKDSNHFVLTSYSKVLLSLIEAWLGDRIVKIYRGEVRQHTESPTNP